jgi:hypothetical protein
VNRPLSALPAVLLSITCGGSTLAPPSTPTASMSAAPPATVSASGCGAQVVIAFYADAACSAEVGRRRYDTSQACFSWTAAGSAAMENSATRFQCYRDRLCYTQHPNTHTCGGGGLSTDKEAHTGACLEEPNGALYSRIVSGTELCPAAPAGFECPRSAAGAGTTGVLACFPG